MTFGQRLRELRMQKHLTQEDIGKLINVTKASISLYERNNRAPDQEMLIKLAKYFDVSVDYLLGISDSKKQFDLDDNVVMTFEGRKIPPEDIELMKRLLRGIKNDR